MDVITYPFDIVDRIFMQILPRGLRQQDDIKSLNDNGFLDHIKCVLEIESMC